MKVIAIDFDNTIKFNSGASKEARIQINKLIDNPNNFIVIYTSRRKDQREYIENYLQEKDISYHALVMEKLRADIYIDDKNKGGLKW